MEYSAIGDYDQYQVAHLVEELGIPISVLEKEAKLGIKRKVINGALIIKMNVPDFGEVFFELETLELEKQFGFEIEYKPAQPPKLTEEQKQKIYADLHSNRHFFLPGIRPSNIPDTRPKQFRGRYLDDELDIDNL